MKKLLLTVVLSAALKISLACYSFGGQIEYSWVGGNTFEITATVYYHVTSPTLYSNYVPSSINVCVFDRITNTQGLYRQLNKKSVQKVIHSSSGCEVPRDSLYGCIAKAVYMDTVSLPNNSNGYYLSCGFMAIGFSSTPSFNFNSILYTEMPDPALHNSSPKFNIDPEYYLADKPATQTSLAVDTDGDSLVYYLTTPFVCDTFPSYFLKPTNGFALMKYNVGYSDSLPFGNSSTAPVIDINSGSLQIYPQTPGGFILSLVVEEWRNGIKIGEVHKELRNHVTYLPSVTGLVNLVGSTLFSQDTVVGIQSRWIDCNTGTQVGWGHTFTPTISGSYAVELRYGYYGACTDTSNCTYVVVAGTGINDQMLNANKLSVFPNPASEKINIDLGNRNIESVEIVNELGMVVHFANPSEISRKQIDVTAIAPGIYFVRVSGNNTIYSSRVVVK